MRTCDDLIFNNACAGISFRQNFTVRAACLQYEDDDNANARIDVGDVVVVVDREVAVCLIMSPCAVVMVRRR